MAPELARLLRRIRDGEPGVPVPDGLVAQARALLAADPAVPPELAAIVFEDDPTEGAAALLGILGIDDPLGSLLADAVRSEAGEGREQPVSAQQLWELEQLTPWPIAHSVRAEAGHTEVAATIAAELGAPVHPIQGAILALAGEVDVTPQVLAALKHEPPPVAAAVREEAGPIGITSEVLAVVDQSWVSAMLDRELSGEAHREAVARLSREPQTRALMTHFADIGRSLQGSVREEAGQLDSLWPTIAAAIGISDPERVSGYDPTLVVQALQAEAGAPIDIWPGVAAGIRPARPQAPAANTPAPANNNWAWVSLLAAAVALIVLSVGGSSTIVSEGSRLAASPMSFASAEEIKVDDLQYAENTTVQVFQSDEGQGPLIIWVNEETTL